MDAINFANYYYLKYNPNNTILTTFDKALQAQNAYITFSGVFQTDGRSSVRATQNPVGMGTLITDHIVQMGATQSMRVCWERLMFPKLSNIPQQFFQFLDTDYSTDSFYLVFKPNPGAMFEKIEELKKLGTIFDVVSGYTQLKNCILQDNIPTQTPSTIGRLETTIQFYQMTIVDTFQDMDLGFQRKINKGIL